MTGLPHSMAARILGFHPGPSALTALEPWRIATEWLTVGRRGWEGGSEGGGWRGVRERGELRPCRPCPGVGEGWGRVSPVSGASSVTIGYLILVLFQSLVLFLAAFLFPSVSFELTLTAQNLVSVYIRPVCITMPFVS